MSKIAKKSLAVNRSGRWAVPLMLVWIVFAQGAPVFELDAWGSCHLTLNGTHITDFGDGDGIADTNETLEIAVSLQTLCRDESADVGLSDCVAWLSTESPAIDCMRRPEILIGDLPGTGPVVTPDETFEIKIGSIDRHDLGLGPDDRLYASLTLDLRCTDGSEILSISETFALQLDLNVSDLGQTPIEWREGFEDGGIDPQDPLLGTAFFAENLDAGLPGNDNTEGLVNADGWRCQYSDPDWHNSGSYNHEQGLHCYPGWDLAQADAVFWQLDGSLVPDTPDGGRAYRGEKSMYYGVFLGLPEENFTTPLSTVESAATHELINLGSGDPELSFWQQISLLDHRSLFNAGHLRNIDRGVVQIKLHDALGRAVSDWMNLQPIQNSFDQQAADNFFNCLFDTVDDGNNEDDFFDPTDPDREYGPSSTCFPGLSWANMGSTTAVFGAHVFGNATTVPYGTDEPPPPPSLGVGNWIETKVDLSEFRGRRAKLRFLVSSFKGPTGTVFGVFGGIIDELDDGWWIDEIVIDETLAEPAAYLNDSFLLGSCTGTQEPCVEQCRWSLAPCSSAVPCGEGEGDCVSPCPSGEICAGPPPDCGANCTAAQTNLFIEPDGPLNPESVTRSDQDGPVTVNFAAPFDIETGAAPSWVDVCIDGYKEYRVCVSGDPDGDQSGTPDADCDDPWDSPVCVSCSPGWTLESVMVPPQDVVTTYAVEVRCSSVPDCRDSRTLEIVVECSGGLPNTYGLREMRALNRETLTWRGALDVDWLRGSFLSSADVGGYVADFTDTRSASTAIPMNGDPPAGSGYYYLVKRDGPVPTSHVYDCDTATWRSGGDAEKGDRNRRFGDP